MCNHEPIVIHEHGGQTVICLYCRAVLQPWCARGEAGQAWPIVAFLVSLAVLLSGAVWLALCKVNYILADAAAVVAFLAAFWWGLKMVAMVCGREVE